LNYNRIPSSINDDDNSVWNVLICNCVNMFMKMVALAFVWMQDDFEILSETMMKNEQYLHVYNLCAYVWVGG